MDKHTIITLKNSGKSNRQVAKMTGFDRKTVARYWNDYLAQVELLEESDDVRVTQEAIIEKPKYDSSNRKAYKYTTEIDEALDKILESEERKKVELGKSNKQMLSCAQIHRMLVEQGFDIGLTTISTKVKEKRKRAREAFIRQEYDLADRLEYDFGEVTLIIGGITSVYHMAVFGAPASKFRWAYLYRNQKKEVFLDSHVRFFEMCGGTWREMVYDNMKNVVKRFIGRNEKELNDDLVKMSLYYGFSINTTNCFSGNEKGFVEGSVKVIRKEAFAKKYHFDSLEDAQRHLADTLEKTNTDTSIEEEQALLLPYRPPLEIARISEHKVDKYSFIRLENNFFSVPDYLVGKTVCVKSYPCEVVVYSGLEKVCVHQKPEGMNNTVVDIFHYLDTLMKKPGALSNSVALKSKTSLKALFDAHYRKDPRRFVEILVQNKDRTLPEIATICESAAISDPVFFSTSPSAIGANVLANTRKGLGAISEAFLKGGARHAS